MTVTGVLGELLITAGVVVLLFLGWQLWFNDLVVGSQLRGESVQQAQQWDKDVATAVQGTPESPPVPAKPADQSVFALMIVPRFGADFYRPIAEGTGTRAVLNKGLIGHYPTTQLPGEPGNFALAAHRSSPFDKVNQLQVGDRLYIETADGWYEYTFRNLEFVLPSGVGVIDPVPQSAGGAAADRFLTLTTCNPIYSVEERIVAYSLYSGFYPRADGAPDEIAATVAGGS